MRIHHVHDAKQACRLPGRIAGFAGGIVWPSWSIIRVGFSWCVEWRRTCTHARLLVVEDAIATLDGLNAGTLGTWEANDEAVATEAPKVKVQEGQDAAPRGRDSSWAIAAQPESTGHDPIAECCVFFRCSSPVTLFPIRHYPATTVPKMVWKRAVTRPAPDGKEGQSRPLCPLKR